MSFKFIKIEEKTNEQKKLKLRLSSFCWTTNSLVLKWFGQKSWIYALSKGFIFQGLWKMPRKIEGKKNIEQRRLLSAAINTASCEVSKERYE